MVSWPKSAPLLGSCGAGAAGAGGGEHAARAARALLLRGLNFEPGVRRGDVMPRLKEKLSEMAAWLDLDRVLLRGERRSG